MLGNMKASVINPDINFPFNSYNTHRAFRFGLGWAKRIRNEGDARNPLKHQ